MKDVMTHKYEGGRYLLDTSCIHNGLHAHTSALEEPLSENALDAINIIQNTEWIINTFIHDVASQAMADCIDVGPKGLPAQQPLPIPARLEEGVWDSLDRIERNIHLGKVKMAHTKEKARSSKVDETFRKLNVAETMRQDNRFYFPHYFCFRGRIYPDSNDLHPQSDDLGQSLMMFANGLPLGQTGLYWLMVHTANKHGEDKLPMAERYDWTEYNLDWIMACAERPFENLEWTKADKPWGFLAAANELRQAFSMNDPLSFVSHISVAQDGSVNGFQHLSMMGRDEVGAKATNCANNEEPEDLYSEVLDILLETMNKDDDPVAVEWLAKGVTRDTVKRSIMTIPYGVTDMGIRQFMIDDGHTSGLEDETASARYMQMAIKEALSEAMTVGRQIMQYFQETAKVLAENGLPLRWVTPNGSICEQAYYALSATSIRTLAGRVTLSSENRDSVLNVSKMTLSSAPNVVHSCDAAHLQDTVVAAHKAGIRSFHMIHDSFGCHAANVSLLRDVLRETAYLQYSGNYLQDFHTYVQSYAGDVVLPTPPRQGSFDMSQVVVSDYFFA